MKMNSKQFYPDLKRLPPPVTHRLQYAEQRLSPGFITLSKLHILKTRNFFAHAYCTEDKITQRACAEIVRYCVRNTAAEKQAESCPPKHQSHRTHLTCCVTGYVIQALWGALGVTAQLALLVVRMSPKLTLGSKLRGVSGRSFWGRIGGVRRTQAVRVVIQR